MPSPQTSFLGLRTVIVPAADLAAAKAWYTSVLGFPPYFDQPFYVGFNVGGFELGLDPNAGPVSPSHPASGPVAYWGVSDADAALARLVSLGAVEVSGVQDVGEGIRVAQVMDPFGNPLGIIENPHFKLPG
jgi:catechol 2,3-dioxygenase-like lactoylglutathione lyase family enzyme